MDYLLFVCAVILIVLGLIGDVIPGIPGTPVTYLALLLLHWTEKVSYTTDFLVITGVICVAITVLDYIVPVWGTKRFGGTKAGARGSTIGLIISVIVLPMLGIVLGPFGIFGLLGGPFLGAYSAFGSFVGFLAGTFMKIVYTLVIGFFVVKDIIMAIID